MMDVSYLQLTFALTPIILNRFFPWQLNLDLNFGLKTGESGHQVFKTVQLSTRRESHAFGIAREFFMLALGVL